MLRALRATLHRNNGRTTRAECRRGSERFTLPKPCSFRYSAVTFNTHRIHYDRRYAMEVERYPGLVVHGPLIATLLLDLAQTRVDSDRIQRFHFRAKRPTFDTSDFSVCGAPAATVTARCGRPTTPAASRLTPRRGSWGPHDRTHLARVDDAHRMPTPTKNFFVPRFSRVSRIEESTDFTGSTFCDATRRRRSSS
jgi:hypothetical protein